MILMFSDPVMNFAAVVAIYCQQFIKYSKHKMGQSMDVPKQAASRRLESRYSTRSLHKSLRRSNDLERRGSLSASKMQNNINNQQNEGHSVTQNTQIRNGELFIMSRHEEHQTNLRDINHINPQNVVLGGEGEVKSPGFKQVGPSGGDYGLLQWPNQNSSKVISPNDSHNHEITISFSKAKNSPNNPFHEDSQERKSNLKQILQYGDEEHGQESRNNQTNGKKEYLDTEIDNIIGLKSIYSQNYKTPGNSTDNTPKKDKNQKRVSQKLVEPKRKVKKLNVKKQSQEVPLNPEPKHITPEQNLTTLQNEPIEEKLTPCFNDYDTEFAPKEKVHQASKHGIKLSKKMQQLKEKIASRATSGKAKQNVQKYSIQNLSVSCRHIRNSCSLDKSKTKNNSKLKNIKEKLSKTYMLLEQNRSSDTLDERCGGEVPQILKSDQKMVKEGGKNVPSLKVKKSQLIQDAKKLKVKEKDVSEKLEQVKPFSRPIKLTHTSRLHQMISPQPAKPKKQMNSKVERQACENQGQKKYTFTDMIRKGHHGNKKKSKGKNTQSLNSTYEGFIKFSELIQTKDSTQDKLIQSKTIDINRSISLQEYEFQDCQALKNSFHDGSPKGKNRQIKHLKKIAEQLNRREAKLKSSQYSLFNQPSQNNSTANDNTSMRNKSCSYDKHPANMTTTNYRDMMRNFQEYMLHDALGRPREKKGSVIKQDKRKAKSLERFKINGSKNKLIIF